MKAHELLDSEEKWCRRVLAMTKDGRTISPTNESAASWCIVGAIIKCYHENAKIQIEMINKVTEAAALGDIANSIALLSGFNDHANTTYEKVLSFHMPYTL